MKVAFTSTNGANVDDNFRKADSYSVWDIGPEESYYVTTVFIKNDADNEDDKIAIRAEALKECVIVCAQEISGPAAAKLVARHIHPMKTGKRVSVDTIIDQLQGALRHTPAPWLRKAHSKDHYTFWHSHSNSPLDDSILDATLADLLSRYPESAELLLGPGFALFPDENSLVTTGAFMKVRDALAIRGICPDLFQMLLEEAIEDRLPHAA